MRIHSNGRKLLKSDHIQKFSDQFLEFLDETHHSEQTQQGKHFGAFFAKIGPKLEFLHK